MAKNHTLKLALVSPFGSLKPFFAMLRMVSQMKTKPPLPACFDQSHPKTGQFVANLFCSLLPNYIPVRWLQLHMQQRWLMCVFVQTCTAPETITTHPSGQIALRGEASLGLAGCPRLPGPPSACVQMAWAIFCSDLCVKSVSNLINVQVEHKPK